MKTKRVLKVDVEWMRKTLADVIWQEPPGISKAELQCKFGVCRQVLNRELKVLIENGTIIETSGHDSRARYYMQGN